jgi:hypothetical protein
MHSTRFAHIAYAVSLEQHCFSIFDDRDCGTGHLVFFERSRDECVKVRNRGICVCSGEKYPQTSDARLNRATKRIRRIIFI